MDDKTKELDTYFYADQTNGSEPREFSAELIAAGIEALTRLRREWQRDLDLARSELRELQATSRNITLEMRNESLQLQTIMREQIKARLAELKDGQPGLPGAPGERGEKGERGDIGKQGPQGESGEAGRAGERGEAGEKGMAGERGEPGPAGESIVGQTGPQGERGERGEKGERGEPGRCGEIGEPGRRGPRGECGQRGEKGEPGDTGAPGERGAPGADGKSFRHRGTYDPDATDYLALDYVVLDHTVFTAKVDNPGPCPGPGWQAGPCGKKGEKGLPGERGPRGRDAPLWTGLDMDGWTLTARMSDGSAGPQIDLRSVLTGIRIDRSSYSLVLGDDLRLSLRELFEEYDNQKNAG